MIKGKEWLAEDEEYLQKNWGRKSIFTLMESLNRTESAIYTKAYKMGLGSFKDNLNGVTLRELAAALNKSESCIQNFIKLYNLPYRTIQSTSHTKKVYVNLGEWWRWLSVNRDKVDFTLFEKHALGPEPAWVDEQRAADQYDVYKKKSYTEWTSHEIATLKRMLSEFKYTTEEIADELQRSPIAVLSKIKKLGILLRPIIKETKKPYWTEDEVDLLERMWEQDKSLNEMAAALNRTKGAIQSKLNRLKAERKKEVEDMIAKGKTVGYISPATCQQLRTSKEILQELDAKIRQKIGYYVSIGKAEDETNSLIAEEFMEQFGAEYENYRKIENEIRMLLDCSPKDVFHIDFVTGEVRTVN